MKGEKLMTRKLLARIIIILALAMFGFALFQLYGILSQYNKAGQEYDGLTEMVSISKETTSGDDSDLNETGKEETDLLADAGIPALDVDYTRLKEINSDYLFWLYIPELEISYPVVKSADNEDYLHKTFEGERNSSGCIFLSCHGNEDLSDFNTFLYGHNMKNGSMFGSLKKYTKDEQLYDKAPCFFLYSDKASYKYRIYSYYITAPKSETFAGIADTEAYSKYIDRALRNSLRNCNVEIDRSQPTVTLSTCSGSGANKKRLVFHGILEEKVEKQ